MDSPAQCVGGRIFARNQHTNEISKNDVVAKRPAFVIARRDHGLQQIRRFLGSFGFDREALARSNDQSLCSSFLISAVHLRLECLKALHLPLELRDLLLDPCGFGDVDYDPEPCERALIAAWSCYRFIKPTDEELQRALSRFAEVSKCLDDLLSSKGTSVKVEN